MNHLMMTDDLKLKKEELHEIIMLITNEWPKENTSIEDRVTNIIESAKSDKNNKCIRFIVWEENKCIAHASIFARNIYYSDSALTIRGLGDVCVDPKQRGRGLGKLVVEGIFNLVSENGWEPVLFQTAIPEFYQKLGCCRITNRFYNSKNTDDPQANPFWDDNIMIFPKSYNFLDGDIDLNGGGF